MFHPIAGEYDLVGKNPDASLTIKNVDGYHNALEELKGTLGPELELIEARVVGPVKEYQQVLKQIRKSITKRDHKLVDYDRFNNSLTKLRDKKEKTLNDEKNLFKVRAVPVCERARAVVTLRSSSRTLRSRRTTMISGTAR